ncbi:MAG: sulfurtransferase TusA [Agarilytica sp.]
MTHKISATVDASGLICPEPIMMLHNAVRDAKVGEVIELIATDPATPRDVQQFCEFLGHVLLEQKKGAEHSVFLIEKKA